MKKTKTKELTPVPEDEVILKIIRLSVRCSWEHLQDGWSDMDRVNYIKENWNK